MIILLTMKRGRVTGFKDHDFAAIADFDMVRNAVDAAKALGVDARVGNLFSADLFYSPDGEMFDVMEKYGILGVEMEAAGIGTVISVINPVATKLRR